MKKIIVIAVAFIATFAASIELYSSDKARKPNEYCRYDKDKGTCNPNAPGSLCYLVNDDCSWME